MRFTAVTSSKRYLLIGAIALSVLGGWFVRHHQNANAIAIRLVSYNALSGTTIHPQVTIQDIRYIPHSRQLQVFLSGEEGIDSRWDEVHLSFRFLEGIEPQLQEVAWVPSIDWLPSEEKVGGHSKTLLLSKLGEFSRLVILVQFGEYSMESIWDIYPRLVRAGMFSNRRPATTTGFGVVVFQHLFLLGRVAVVWHGMSDMHSRHFIPCFQVVTTA